MQPLSNIPQTNQFNFPNEDQPQSFSLGDKIKPLLNKMIREDFELTEEDFNRLPFKVQYTMSKQMGEDKLAFKMKTPQRRLIDASMEVKKHNNSGCLIV